MKTKAKAKLKPKVRYAAKGLPKVPGQPKGPDVVPAWLRPGEAVLTPQAAEMLGRGNIQRLNQQGMRLGDMTPRYYADGEEEVARVYQQDREREAGALDLAMQVASANGAFSSALGGTGRYALSPEPSGAMGRGPVAAPGETIDTGRGWQTPNPLPGQLVDTAQGWQTPNAPVPAGEAIDTGRGWQVANPLPGQVIDTPQGWMTPNPAPITPPNPDDQQPQYFMSGTAQVSRLGAPLYFAGGGMIDPKTGRPYADTPATPQPSAAYNFGRNVASTASRVSEPFNALGTGAQIAQAGLSNQASKSAQSVGQGIADVARGVMGKPYAPPAPAATQPAQQPVLGQPQTNPDANFAKPIAVTDRAGRQRIFDNPAMMAAAAPTLMQNKEQAFGPEYYQDRTIEHARGNYGAPSQAKMDLIAKYAGKGQAPVDEYVDVYYHGASPEQKAQIAKNVEANRVAESASLAQYFDRMKSGISAVPEWRPDYRPPASPRDQLLQQQLQGEQMRQRQLASLYSLATTSPSDSPRTANALAMYNQLAGSYGGSPGAMASSFGSLTNQQGNPAENQWRLGQANLSQAQAGIEQYKLQHPELLGTRQSGEWKPLGGDNYLPPEGQTGFPLYNTVTGEGKVLNPTAPAQGQPKAPPTVAQVLEYLRNTKNPDATEADARALLAQGFGVTN